MEVKICDTQWSQIRGLMFSRRKNLLFVYKRPIYIDLHMLFVFFPVDALYLNDDMEIVEIKHMKPFRDMYRAKYKTRYVIELTEKHTFVVGDRMEIKENEVCKAM